MEPSDISAIEAQQIPVEEPYQDDELPEVRTGWVPVKTADWEWALSRLASILEHKDAIEAARAEAHRRIDLRADSLIEKDKGGEHFFRFVMEQGANAVRDFLLGGGKKKSRTFLHGVVGWRSQPGRLRVEDKAALEAWLLGQSDLSLYRTKVEPELKALNAYYERTHQIPPGCLYEEDKEHFYAKPEPSESTLLAKVK